MITRAPPHPDADAGDFASVHIHTRRLWPRGGRNAIPGEAVDGRLLERRHEITHPEPGASQIDERIHNQLPGPVVGDLTPAISAHHRNVPRSEHMRRVGVNTKGEYGFMLEHPDFICGVKRALIGEALHRLPDRQVLGATEITDEAVHQPRAPRCRARRCCRRAPARRDSSSARAAPIRIHENRAPVPTRDSDRTPPV